MLADGGRRAALAVLVALGLWTGLTGAVVDAAEIKVLSTVGMQPATVELFKSFEAATGHKILVTYGLAAVLRTSVLEGAPADVLVLTSATIDDLVKSGRSSRPPRPTSPGPGVGVGVKAGAPKPDISTPEALKRTIVAAKSIGYSREAPWAWRLRGRSSVSASPSRSRRSTRIPAPRPVRWWLPGRSSWPRPRSPS